MRKELQTIVYFLCNSAVVLNKSGKTGSACEERWDSQANIMNSKITFRRPGNSALSFKITDEMVVEYMGEFRNTVYNILFGEPTKLD